MLCGPNESEIAEKIIKEIGPDISVSLSNKSIAEIVPIISVCDMYIGNDSFGHHVASQCGIPSIIVMLDTPSAYSDYSNNQYRILPDGVSIKDIDHNSIIDPNRIKVEKVYEKALTLL